MPRLVKAKQTDSIFLSVCVSKSYKLLKVIVTNKFLPTSSFSVLADNDNLHNQDCTFAFNMMIYSYTILTSHSGVPLCIMGPNLFSFFFLESFH